MVTKKYKKYFDYADWSLSTHSFIYLFIIYYAAGKKFVFIIILFN